MGGGRLMPRSSVCPLVLVLEAPLEKSCLLIHWHRVLPVKLHPSRIPCHSVCEQGRRLPGASCICMCSCSVHAAACMECPPPHKILPTFYGPSPGRSPQTLQPGCLSSALMEPVHSCYSVTVLSLCPLTDLSSFS